MQVATIPLTDFVHGTINAQEGRSLMLDEALAVELERLGLIRIKMLPEHANKMMPAPENKSGKAQDDGLGQLSSASPVAQASPLTTLHLPARGPGRPRKTGT